MSYLSLLEAQAFSTVFAPSNYKFPNVTKPIKLYLKCAGLCLLLYLMMGTAFATTAPSVATAERPLIQRIVSWWQNKTLPHQRYAEKLLKAGPERVPASDAWLKAAARAIQQPFSLSTAHDEVGRFNQGEVRADGYLVAVKKGQKLSIELTAAGNFNGQLFVDLFQKTPLQIGRRQSVDKTPPTLLPEYSLLEGKVIDGPRQHQALFEQVPEYDGHWLLRLQPALQTNANYQLRVSVAPALGFPVQNASNSAARSFFGADRDAGRRRHHGVDIFAARNTPVVAVADGTVVQVSRSPRGGLHVWLRDTKRRAAYYYAHLETATVTRGQRVARGDILGGVGNSGNARTTKPHLHFGIYHGGPIDPWPYIRQLKSLPPTENPRNSNIVGQQVEFTSSGSARLRLRSGPGTDFAIRDQLQPGSKAEVLAATADWLKLRTDDGLLGWASASYLELVAAAVIRERGNG